MKRGTTITAAAIVAVILTCSSGCSRPGNSYSEFHQLPGKGWSYDQSVCFIPEHPDSTATGKLAVALRHDSNFPFTTIWLEVSHNTGKRINKDTLSIPLADDFGRWNGHGIGISYQVTDTLKTTITHSNGETIKIRHIMRNDTLRSISQVGIFFIAD